jgi:hypothetical protein
MEAPGCHSIAMPVLPGRPSSRVLGNDAGCNSHPSCSLALQSWLWAAAHCLHFICLPALSAINAAMQYLPAYKFFLNFQRPLHEMYLA